MSEKGQGSETGTSTGTSEARVQIDEGTAMDTIGDEVVVEVRGDFVLDASGETVDSDSVGLAAPPSSQSTPRARPSG